MANLSITTKCNARCSYCFARPAFRLQPPAQPHMSLAVYKAALNFLERSRIDQVRLLGGEPTLHPQFTRLVDLALDRGFRLLVFSNGLMPRAALHRLADAPPDRVAVALNITPGTADGKNISRKLAGTLQLLGPQITLSLNIASPAVQFEHLLPLMSEFQLAPFLRLGLAQPTFGGQNRFLHPRYYPEAGRRLAQFMATHGRGQISLEFDCGVVPCMFPPDALSSWGYSLADLGRRCSPILDILADGQVVACYPLAQLHRQPLPAVDEADRLREQFAARLAPYRSVTLSRDCADCPLLQTGDCLGGCVAAALQRLRSQSGRLAGRAKSSVVSASCPDPLPAGGRAPSPDSHRGLRQRASAPGWIIPYIDQPLPFWEKLRDVFGRFIQEVYFPLPGQLLGSGRPPQPERFLTEFLQSRILPASVLLNPVVLPRPLAELAPQVVAEVKRLQGDYGLAGATVSSLLLAQKLRDQVPDLPLTASVVMDIAQPQPALLLRGICGTVVPASRIVRDLEALRTLRRAFGGRLRLLVNEACLPGCPFRTQHFFEMGSGFADPGSLCQDVLARHPWLRLTGAWILPQHLHLYDGLYDELKLAGRVTLQDPSRYYRVLNAYAHRLPLTPEAIGGGPASPLEPVEIDEEFFALTLQCGRQCQQCQACREYWRHAAGLPEP